jgi:hypothetical protein
MWSRLLLFVLFSVAVVSPTGSAHAADQQTVDRALDYYSHLRLASYLDDKCQYLFGNGFHAMLDSTSVWLGRGIVREPLYKDGEKGLINLDYKAQQKSVQMVCTAEALTEIRITGERAAKEAPNRDLKGNATELKFNKREPPPTTYTDEKNKEMFLDFLKTREYHDALEKLVNMAEPKSQKATCANLKVNGNGSYSIVRPIYFDGTGKDRHIASGLWIAITDVDRCGEKVKRRTELWALPFADNSVIPTAMLPGDFRGSHALDSKVRRMILPDIAKAVNCKDKTTAHVLDVTFIGGTTLEGWSETWKMEACGAVLSPKITYKRGVGGLDMKVTDIPAASGSGK